jgi:hypothetical protein
VRRLVSRWNVFIEPSLAPSCGRLAVVVSGALAMPRHCGSDSPVAAGKPSRQPFVGVRKSFGVKTDDRASTSPQV